MDEGVRLLSECRVKSSTEGSNPSLSAIIRSLAGSLFGYVPLMEITLQNCSVPADRYQYTIMEDEKELRDDEERDH